MNIAFERLPDGSFIDWGRHWRLFRVNGKPIKNDRMGGAVVYSGESAKVIELIIKHQKERGVE